MREFSSASRVLYLPHLGNVFLSRYDIFAINLAAVMLGYVYGHTPGPTVSRNAASCGLTVVDIHL